MPAFPVEVVSTHGAGDAFVEALAARRALGEGWEAALKYAQAAALHVSARDRAGIGLARVAEFLRQNGCAPDGRRAYARDLEISTEANGVFADKAAVRCGRAT